MDDSDDSYDSYDEEYMEQSDLDEKLVECASGDDYYGVKKYLKKGANPNTKDYYGITPLNYAAIDDGDENSIDIMEILLKYGAKINLKENTEYGNTALMNAAIYSYDNVKYLLNAGADPFIVNSIGNTAYDNAIKSEKYESAKLLKSYMMMYKMQRRRRRNLTYRKKRTQLAHKNLALSKLLDTYDVDEPSTRDMRRETIRSIMDY